MELIHKKDLLFSAIELKEQLWWLIIFPNIIQTKKSSSKSSESDAQGSKASKNQTALPIILQMQSQSQKQLNVIFVVNVILKMGLP